MQTTGASFVSAETATFNQPATDRNDLKAIDFPALNNGDWSKGLGFPPGLAGCHDHLTVCTERPNWNNQPKNPKL
jgi:hypothetical protein